MNFVYLFILVAVIGLAFWVGRGPTSSKPSGLTGGGGAGTDDSGSSNPAQS